MLPKVEFISLRNMYRIASYRVISYVVISCCVTQLVFVSKNVIKVLSLCQQRRLLLFIISAVCECDFTRQPFACSHFSSVFSHKWPFVRKINNFRFIVCVILVSRGSFWQHLLVLETLFIVCPSLCQLHLNLIIFLDSLEMAASLQNKKTRATRTPKTPAVEKIETNTTKESEKKEFTLKLA